MRSLLAASALVCAALVHAQTISFLAPVDAISSGSSRISELCGSCIGVADLNGDGKPDIVFAASESGGAPFSGVAFGNGDGTFRVTTSNGVIVSPFNGVNFTAMPAVGDFNGDGRPDVIMAGQNLSLLYTGNGDGTFSGPLQIGQCTVSYNDFSQGPGQFAVDLNHDGTSDLVCDNIVVLSNEGSFKITALLDGKGLLAADFNHDGNPDLLIVTSSGQLAVVPGHGDGTFGADLPISTPVTLPVVSGDFNGDGLIDLATLSKDGSTVIVLPGKGDGTFGAPLATAGAPGQVMAAADFNGDGKLDLVAGDAILAGNGDGTFRFPVFVGAVADTCGAAANPTLPSFFPCSYTRISTVVADFNGDGLPDLAAGTVVQGPESATVATASVLLNDSPGDGFTSTGISSATGAWPVGAGSIVSMFGANLAPKIEAAGSNPAPTTLGGIRLHVRDRSHANDMLAPLLYVSPTQINYVLPSSDPFAFVSIERVGSPFVAKGMAVEITPLAPGIFEFADFAAATAVRVNADGSQTELPVVSCVPGGCASIPIDVTTGTVYLSLYGTGFDQATTSSTSCTVAGKSVPVAYAGPEVAVAGLDQVNLLLPPTLAGSGMSAIRCLFNAISNPFPSEGTAANPVKVIIR